MSIHAHRPELETFARRKLLERQHQLSRALGRARREAGELYETREPDWEDQAANLTGAAGIDRLGEGERDQLTVVTAALDRLDEGTWGRCARCGTPIPEERLRALPEATCCMSCTASAGGIR